MDIERILHRPDGLSVVATTKDAIRVEFEIPEQAEPDLSQKAGIGLRNAQVFRRDA
ncbi:hypothetical protein D3C87_2030790 [compost metagenome]